MQLTHWTRRHRSRPAGLPRSATPDDVAHLREFARTRSGVEAYLEPRTAVSETTLVLVATDGEWTRRRIAGPQWARAFAAERAIPLYDAATVGYPRRMREYRRVG